jgi:hypothetical protein
LFGAIDEGLEESTEFYETWNSEVVRSVPADRLLIFNVKQGWKPLCQFLDLPVPGNETPFPNFNDTKSFKKKIRNIKIGGFVLVYVLPVALAALGFVFRKSIPHILKFW